MAGRTQFVHFNDIHSNECKLQCGILQRSKLRALLFNILINDMLIHLYISFNVYYTDDTSIYIKDSAINTLFELLKVQLV